MKATQPSTACAFISCVRSLPMISAAGAEPCLVQRGLRRGFGSVVFRLHGALESSFRGYDFGSDEPST